MTLTLTRWLQINRCELHARGWLTLRCPLRKLCWYIGSKSVDAPYGQALNKRKIYLHDITIAQGYLNKSNYHTYLLSPYISFVLSLSLYIYIYICAHMYIHSYMPKYGAGNKSIWLLGNHVITDRIDHISKNKITFVSYTGIISDVRAWIRNFVNSFLRDLITHPCLTFNGKSITLTIYDMDTQLNPIVPCGWNYLFLS